MWLVSIYPLHYDEPLPVDLLQPVDCRDVLVAEGCQQPRLSLEPGHALGISGEGLRQHLVALRASMSTRFIRKHLSEIPHYRASARGKIWIDWLDFQSWVRKLRVEIGRDDQVVDVLRDLAQYGAAKWHERQGR